jgi:tetrahydromethanopterin S-methyltransferase subunit B
MEGFYIILIGTIIIALIAFIISYREDHAKRAK